MSAVTFQIDQFNAVIFPPLVEGATEMQIWQAFARQVGDDAATTLSDEHGYENACLLALAVYHATRLCHVADGDARTVTEAAVRETIAGGALFNLRPLTLEDRTPTSFAPVLQRIGDRRWRLGLKGQGRCEEFITRTSGEAIERALKLYAQWRTQET